MKPEYDELMCLIREDRVSEAQRRILLWLTEESGQATMSWNANTERVSALDFPAALHNVAVPASHMGSLDGAGKVQAEADLVAAKKALAALFAAELEAAPPSSDTLFEGSMNGHRYVSAPFVYNGVAYPATEGHYVGASLGRYRSPAEDPRA